MSRMVFNLPLQFLQVFSPDSEAGFVQLGLRSLFRIMDFQVNARLPGYIDEVRGNPLGVECVQDKSAIAARHQPQRIDRGAQMLERFGDVDSLPPRVYAVYFTTVGSADFKTTNGHALIDRRVQGNGCNHQLFPWIAAARRGLEITPRRRTKAASSRRSPRCLRHIHCSPRLVSA